MCWPRWHGLWGVDWSDANLAGSLIGQKLAINEFVAYLNFSPYLQTSGTLDVKTIAIISFALCGFANFGSIGVVVGAFSAISPKTRAGNRPAWFTGAGGGDAFQPDERDHCRVLYWFSLSFIAGCTRLLSVASGNRVLYSSYFKLHVLRLRSLTPVTYLCKLLGDSLACRLPATRII